MTIADEIDRLAAQRAAGHLSDAEFEAAKARLFAAPPVAEPWSAVAADAEHRVRNLRRSITDRWIGGVCGGIARTVGVESWMVRLAFVVTLLLAGFGLLPYVLLWIFVPEDGR